MPKDVITHSIEDFTDNIRKGNIEKSGNLGLSNEIFIKDMISPQIEILFPFVDSTTDNQKIFYGLNIIDKNLDCIWFSFGGNNYYTYSAAGQTDLGDKFFEMDEITIVFFANDTVGNVGSKIVTIKCNSEEDPWYFDIEINKALFYCNAFAIVSLICIQAVIFEKRRKLKKFGGR